MEGKQKKMKSMYLIFSSLKKSPLKKKGKQKDGERQYYDGAKRCQQQYPNQLLRKYLPLTWIEEKFKGNLRVTVYANVYF